jgi:hypothetical protein
VLTGPRPSLAVVDGETPLEKLQGLRVRGILWQLARDGQIIDVRCEMPQCYCFRVEGTSSRDRRVPIESRRLTTIRDSRCTRDTSHSTTSDSRIGSATDLTTWRVKINAMLGKRMSLEAIAEMLNAEKVPTIHGTNRWTAASVRKAFVS